jgi:hypothetical protein
MRRQHHHELSQRVWSLLLEFLHQNKKTQVIISLFFPSIQRVVYLCMFVSQTNLLALDWHTSGDAGPGVPWVSLSLFDSSVSGEEQVHYTERRSLLVSFPSSLLFFPE